MPDTVMNASYSAELMPNYLGQLPVDAHKDLQAILDNKGKPALLAVGTDQKLRLIRQTQTTISPWETFDITDQDVEHFSVFQIENDLIRLVYSTTIEGRCMLFGAEITLTNNGFIEPNWINYELPDHTETANKISMNQDLLIFSSTSTSHEALYHIIDATGKVHDYKLPEFATEIVDYRIGKYAKRDGLFLLYNMETEQSMIFQGIDPQTGKKMSSISNFTIPQNQVCTSLDLIHTGGKTDILVSGGTAINRYPNADTCDELAVLDEGKYTYLRTDKTGSYSSIWAIEEDKFQRTSLRFLTDYFYDQNTQSFTKRWTEPLLFEKKVRNFSSVKPKGTGNALFMVDETNRLTLVYQDPKTTLWRKTPIVIEDIGKVAAFQSYTSCFEVRDPETQEVREGVDCYITSSSSVDAIVNGVSYYLNSEQPVKIQTDAMGLLTIIARTDDQMDCPIFTVGYKPEETSHIVNPLVEVDAQLSQLKNAQRFKDQRTQEGDALWAKGETPDNSDLGDSAKVIQRMMDTKRSMLNEKRAELTNPQEPIGKGLEDGAWGTKIEGNSVSYLDDEEADREASEKLDDEPKKRGFFGMIGHAIGTVIHALTHIGQKIKKFIVKTLNKVVTLVLKIAGKVLKFIINTLEELFPILKEIFKALKLVIQTVFKWLGKLFGWDKIWETHKVIARTTRNGASYMAKKAQEQLSTMKSEIDSSLDSIISKLHAMHENELPEDEKRKTVCGILGKIMSSPLVRWPLYQLMHGGILGTLKNIFGDKEAKFDSFIEEQGKKYEYVYTFVQEEIKQIVQFLSNPDFSVRGMVKLFSPLLERITQTVKSLIDGILEYVQLALDKAKEVLEDKDGGGFLGTLYKFFTGLLGEKENYNVLNGMALLSAIPITIVYRVQNHGKSPVEGFPEDFGSKEMFDYFDEVDRGEDVASNTRMLAVQEVSNSSYDDYMQFLVTYQKFGLLVGPMTGMISNGMKIIPGQEQSQGLKEFGTVMGYISLVFSIPFWKKVNGDGKSKQAAYGLSVFQFLLAIVAVAVLPNIKRHKGEDKKLKKEGAIVSLVVSLMTFASNLTTDILVLPNGWVWSSDMTTRAGSIGWAVLPLTDRNPYVIAGAFGVGSVGVALSTVKADEGLENLTHMGTGV